ncbi:MAG: hypothetical protein LUH22_14250 [Bacteroides sp.]|nr:hypothetical protein [Bacteroides sp.]
MTGYISRTNWLAPINSAPEEIKKNVYWPFSGILIWFYHNLHEICISWLYVCNPFWVILHAYSSGTLGLVCMYDRLSLHVHHAYSANFTIRKNFISDTNPVTFALDAGSI